MSDANCSSVKELQRQLESHKAQAAQIEKLLQNQFNTAESSAPQNTGDFSLAAAQDDYQLSNHGVDNDHKIKIPRSRSMMGYTALPMAGSMTEQGMPASQAYKRQRRAFSQQSAPSQPMSRTVSNPSESNMPFVQQGPIRAINNPALDRFCSSRDEPANQSLQRGPQRLPSVQENSPLPDVGMDPGEWIANWDCGMSSQPYYAAANRMSLSPQDVYNQIPSACPSMISGSSAGETTSPLTRQNSAFGASSFTGAEMIRLWSSQSHLTDGYGSQDPLFPTGEMVNSNGKRPAPEQDFFGMGANLPVTTFHQYAAEDPNNGLFLESPESADMERSLSGTSTTSNKSTSSNLERRAKEARERVLQNGKATIAPKPQDAADDSTSSNATVKKEAKVALNKSSYQRPKHPKVYCGQCNEHPDGFRGDHELRRHINAKHEGIVKKYVCRDPATVGLDSPVQAINPLNKCKACLSGKQYGAYYNAAAHLRRTHFKPKTPRGKNKGKNEEKRGGKGGGDWPPMPDLKLWFEEIQVRVDQASSLGTQEDAEVDPADVNNQVMFTGIGGGMPHFDLDHNYELALDSGAGPASILAGTTGMPISAPISSASETFGYSPYTEASSLNRMSGEYAFTDQAMSVFSSVSSANTITPATYQDMSNLAVNDSLFEIEV